MATANPNTQMMLQAIMQQLPEVNRRKIAADRAKQSEEYFRQLSSAPGQGNYTPRQQGGWYPTVQKWNPDYEKMGNQIVGGFGQLWAGKKADRAAQEHQDMMGEESLKALQQIGGGGMEDEATAQALRGYLGLIGGPVGKDMMGKAPYVSSTKVDENGKVYMVMSDGTTVDTGRTADYNTRVIDDGNGNLISVGTAGAGRGLAAPVVTGGGQPAPATDPGIIPDQTTGPDGEPVVFGPDISQEVRRTLLGLPASPAGGGAAPGAPVRVQSSAEKAGSAATAKAQAEYEAAQQLAATSGAVKLADEQAKNTAAAQASFGKIKSTVSNVRRAISELANAPGLKDIVGGSVWSRVPDRLTGIALPVFGAGGHSADALAKYQNLTGANFLQAFEQLKGGGQITEKEGEKAEQAFGRLQRSQSLPEFKAALQTLDSVMNDLLTAAEQRANGGGQAQPAAPAPQQQFNLPAGWSVEVK